MGPLLYDFVRSVPEKPRTIFSQFRACSWLIRRRCSPAGEYDEYDFKAVFHESSVGKKRKARVFFVLFLLVAWLFVVWQWQDGDRCDII